jgi:hypothetical protein
VVYKQTVCDNLTNQHTGFVHKNIKPDIDSAAWTMDSLGDIRIPVSKKQIDLQNFIVRVRRQNAQVENVSLMDELNRFTETHYPDYATECIKYPPTGFKFDKKKLQLTEGFS